MFAGLVYHIDALQCYRCHGEYDKNGTSISTDDNDRYCGLSNKEVKGNIKLVTCPSNADRCIVSC